MTMLPWESHNLCYGRLLSYNGSGILTLEMFQTQLKLIFVLLVLYVVCTLLVICFLLLVDMRWTGSVGTLRRVVSKLAQTDLGNSRSVKPMSYNHA